ncbi:hypothetical protein COS31_04065 [Candidatus Roizmanbacteria bacterium CG02_land_8_20_14_3_00_36_15]|uniref:CBS domain-containing protein n=1 Tax=Candidatus Roizmanbacteria bacterium CG_4_8_14_3_um_filter_36_10 TaxID=1974834 RepID=A0A2M8GMY2_9BACT|nr:MAG: hypothetical protein COS31_04065 [Candidatus Roizmanbacteria bacterium CG02_land_8_20_14_3_00_36_15]PJC81901.1 MAG: hypothetical protein CO007_02255 [Candidatus Roizmanbacteria bacterium CG_4_8_14_3_um_filter_36_10]
MVRLKDIIKNENIIRVSSQDTLSSALAKLSTSHDGAFVFSGENKYLGIINPYYCLFKTSYPYNAKVENCLFHAPRIKINTPINKVARLFIESKIHYLPVFDNQDKFIGIISARRLIEANKDSPLFKIKIGDYLKTKKNLLISVYENDLVSRALTLFKEKKVSKLLVLSKYLKLKGILTYYDLISYLIKPRNVERRGDRVGDKINFYHYQVKNFAKNYILTLTPIHLMSEALNLILAKEIGSVVIVDDRRRPLGIITTQDFLRFFFNLKDENKIEISSKNLSQNNRRLVGGFFQRFSFFLKKEPDLVKAKLFVKEEKSGGLFEAVFSLIPKKGQPKVIKKEGKNLFKVLDLFSKILKRVKKEK